MRQRRSERLGQSVFGASYISCASGKEGDELAIAAARDRIRCAARLFIAFAKN